MKNSNHGEKYDFFVSGRWRNRNRVLDLARKIREKGYRVYCFLETAHNSEAVKNNPEEEMKKFEQLNWRKDSRIREVFEEDMAGEKASKIFVMLMPAGKSCHIEAGAAYGLGKKCILIGEQKEAESLYLIFDEVYNSVESFLERI